LNAPRPRPMMDNNYDSKKKRKGRKKNKDNDGQQIEIELERRSDDKDKRKNEDKYKNYNFSRSELEAGEFVAVNLSSSRKYNQFNKILQIGRMNRAKIENNPKLLSRIVESAIASGDSSLIGSKYIVKRAGKLIKYNDPLFEEIESGATKSNQKHIQKLLRKQDVINTVFADIDGANGNGFGGKGFAYSPAELRKLEELPERAPSQRPTVEKKTNIDDDLWDQSNIVCGTKEINGENMADQIPSKAKTKGIDMDDIWEVTGALPPAMMEALEDPYDPWKEDELKPVQKPLRDDEEDEYRDKLTNHFKKRRELLQRKYWLPRWCRYVVWGILILLILILMVAFLYEGNKLGATFLWIPHEFNNTDCTISVSEQTRFDYDYSLDEAQRRNPACSPQEIEGSMPHCWDYRVRFTISSLITLLTSILLVQPLYIAILALIAVTCLPICKPCCISIRNAICGLSKDDPGYKHFLGGTILISGDTNLEYGQLADEEHTVISQMSGDGNEDSSQQESGRGDTKRTPLLN